MAPLDITHRVESATASLLRRTADVAHTLLAGRQDSTEKDCKANPQLCEKPSMTSTNTGIIVGSTVGGLVFIVLSVLIYFHMKRLKRDKVEDTSDPFKMSDWGLDDQPAAAGPNKVADTAVKGTDRQADTAAGQNPFASPADKYVSAR